MVKRDIIKIDEELCTGCGECIPNCPEGALQLIDGKARLVSDLYCDGLGACIGKCPEGAISVENREAGPYDEKKVIKNIIRQGDNVIKAHIRHLREHGESGLLGQALKVLDEKGIDIEGLYPEKKEEKETVSERPAEKIKSGRLPSGLDQWPIQVHLVPPNAPFLKEAHLVIAADCSAFSFAGFHEEFLGDRVLLIGCPKFDDAQKYIEKFFQIFSNNDIKSIETIFMEVPCCHGLNGIVAQAIKRAGKSDIPFKKTKLGIKGDILASTG